MKLITELTEEVKYITEDNGGDKKLFIEGIFLQSNIKNRNGRIYPEEVMDKEVSRYVAESVDKKAAWGELGHPNGPKINPDRISHRIVSLKKEGTNYLGRAIIIPEGLGKIARGMIESDGAIGVSSRGMGTIKVNKSGINEVQGDFRLATAADIVTDPSGPNCWVNGIMENVEWFYDDKVGWISEEVKKHVHKISKRQLEETKMQLFEDYMKKISTFNFNK